MFLLFKIALPVVNRISAVPYVGLTVSTRSVLNSCGLHFSKNKQVTERIDGRRSSYVSAGETSIHHIRIK
jgi:hypothetical protein